MIQMSFYKIIPTILILIIPLFVSATGTDSLLRLLPGASDERKIELYNEIALSCRGSSFAMVKAYSLKSYQLAQTLNLPDKMIAAMTNLAIANVFTGNIDSARTMFIEIYEIADSINDPELKNQALMNLGNFYYNTDQYTLALEYFRLVYPEYVKVNDTMAIARVDQNTGNIHYHLKEYSKALNSFRQARELFFRGGNRDEADKLLNNIGLTFLQLKMYDSARIYMEKGLLFARSANDRLEEMYLLNNTGLLLSETGKYPDAIQRFQEALKISQEISYPQQEANYLINLASVYLKNQQPAEALNSLKKAESIVERVENPGIKRDMHENYFKYYLEKRDYQAALTHYQSFREIQDTIFSRENLNKIAELNIRFETAKKETENIRLKASLEINETKKRRLVFILFTLSLLLISTFIAFLFIGKYLRQKRTIAEHETVLLTERLEHSQQELASKALRLASQNEIRLKVIDAIRSVSGNPGDNSTDQLSTLIKNLENQTDYSAWQEFETRFEQVHETFFSRLNTLFPDLTANDRRICAFLKLNMSTKDIALLTHRSPRSIESARYRLKKKFGLSPEEDILNFLQSI